MKHSPARVLLGGIFVTMRIWLWMDEEKDPYKIAVVRSEEAERTCELVRKNAQKYQENYAKPYRVFTSSRNT